MGYERIIEVRGLIERALEALPKGFLLEDLPGKTVGELAGAIVDVVAKFEEEADAVCREYAEARQWPYLSPMVRAVVQDRLSAAQELLWLFRAGLDVPYDDPEVSLEVVSIAPSVSDERILRWLLISLSREGLSGAPRRLIESIHDIQLHDSIQPSEDFSRN